MVRTAVDKNLVEAFNKYVCSSHCPSIASLSFAAHWGQTYACLCSYEYRYQQFAAVGGGACSGLPIGKDYLSR